MVISNQVMSNPDASAGPYMANEKKPIGGNIMAHASTTRYAANLYCQPIDLLRLFSDCNSRRHEATRVQPRYMIHHVYQSQKHNLPFINTVLETQRKNPDRLSTHTLDLFMLKVVFVARNSDNNVSMVHSYMICLL